MIGFQIRKKGANITATVFNNTVVFDLIYKMPNDETMAIEVSSWSELAGVGDIYETDNFTVEVIG
ncbi:hypothetical protein SOV_33950 [Sporomusa ovata DSM 2662]|uniref:Uncharacterized protein n=1 Tax=Sporomusa ovata TaxID=2378 RepID=A0A0U1L2L9_9FIRM|nr:hypothetical protein [Sporomusa ovata]EQB25330.1 hypothetical protein SOV_5c04980 [Sporomusa ovata DSM 2662]CQR73896.1 hypothetical protein SpAn4DRAFT_0358 [Sporomusa ovata]